MDGKKRIARFRNAEKWMKLGRFFERPAKIKKIDIPKLGGAVQAVVVGKCKMVSVPSMQQTWDMEIGNYIKLQPGVFNHASNFIVALKKRGFKQLGSGAYSTVLAKENSDRVIKVQRGNDNWIDYIKWSAERGYTGGFAPKVYSFKRFPNFAVAIVERMDRDTSGEKDDLALIERLLGPASRGNIMAKLFMEELSPKCTDFFEGLFKDFRDQLDLYGKNIMIRKDGSLCVTDPVCGRSKLTSVKRLRTGDLSPAPLRIYVENSYRHRSQRITQSYPDMGDCLQRH